MAIVKRTWMWIALSLDVFLPSFLAINNSCSWLSTFVASYIKTLIAFGNEKINKTTSQRQSTKYFFYVFFVLFCFVLFCFFSNPLISQPFGVFHPHEHRGVIQKF